MFGLQLDDLGWFSFSISLKIFVKILINLCLLRLYSFFLFLGSDLLFSQFINYFLLDLSFIKWDLITILIKLLCNLLVDFFIIFIFCASLNFNLHVLSVGCINRTLGHGLLLVDKLTLSFRFTILHKSLLLGLLLGNELFASRFESDLLFSRLIQDSMRFLI